MSNDMNHKAGKSKRGSIKIYRSWNLLESNFGGGFKPPTISLSTVQSGFSCPVSALSFGCSNADALAVFYLTHLRCQTFPSRKNTADH